MPVRLQAACLMLVIHEPHLTTAHVISRGRSSLCVFLTKGEQCRKVSLMHYTFSMKTTSRLEHALVNRRLVLPNHWLTEYSTTYHAWSWTANDNYGEALSIECTCCTQRVEKAMSESDCCVFSPMRCAPECCGVKPRKACGKTSSASRITTQQYPLQTYTLGTLDAVWCQFCVGTKTQKRSSDSRNPASATFSEPASHNDWYGRRSQRQPRSVGSGQWRDAICAWRTHSASDGIGLSSSL